MISPATLDAVVGILRVRADELTDSAHRIVDAHNVEHARATLARAAECRAYADEIVLHRVAQGLAAEYSAPASAPTRCPACRFPL